MTAAARAPLGRLDHLTFRGNLRRGRHGWLRLTPAYSLHLVGDLLDKHAAGGPVLDPFCGTGTTSLACAERGIAAETTDINPFLVWLARAKGASYSAADRAAVGRAARDVAKAMKRKRAPVWTPPIHRIERWWSPEVLAALGRARAFLHALDVGDRARDLLDLAFCRASIGCASVSFAHQSMSFREEHEELSVAEVVGRWETAVAEIARASEDTIERPPVVHLADARALDETFAPATFSCVVTSPPYPNRMSYVRELRPYMYWLGYLTDGRGAGELDWRAIGGTWGVATSKVAKWTPPASAPRVPYRAFDAIVRAIRERSDVLARYVAKYFVDATLHARSLAGVIAPGGSVHYIVGNSKFYDVMLPVEAIYAAIFESVGLVRARITTIRKRSSKKELFEFVVSAERPR